MVFGPEVRVDGAGLLRGLARDPAVRRSVCWSGTLWSSHDHHQAAVSHPMGGPRGPFPWAPSTFLATRIPSRTGNSVLLGAHQSAQPSTRLAPLEIDRNCRHGQTDWLSKKMAMLFCALSALYRAAL